MQIVEITIDPERDTVRRPTRIAAAQLELPNWSLLTAAPADLSRLWKFFGVDVEKTAPATGGRHSTGCGAPLTYDLSHTDELFFLDKSGHERFLIDGAPNTKGVLPSPVLDKFLNDQGQANLMNPDASTWTAADATASLAWVLGRHLKSP